MTKKALRDKFLKLREAIPAAQLQQQSKAICAHLALWMSQKSFNQIFFFQSFRNEPDLMPLALQLEAGQAPVKLGLPVIGAAQRDMIFCKWRTSDALSKSRLNTLEPVRSEPLVADANTLILVPALAISTKNGVRLGYGAGFYDVYLKTTAAFTMGVVFDDFLVEDLPYQDHDTRLQGWCTQSRVVTI